MFSFVSISDGLFEQGNETLISIKAVEFLDYTSSYYSLEDPAPWN
jgi:hypothetical protein